MDLDPQGCVGWTMPMIAQKFGCNTTVSSHSSIMAIAYVKRIVVCWFCRANLSVPVEKCNLVDEDSSKIGGLCFWPVCRILPSASDVVLMMVWLGKGGGTAGRGKRCCVGGRERRVEIRRCSGWHSLGFRNRRSSQQKWSSLLSVEGGRSTCAHQA